MLRSYRDRKIKSEKAIIFYHWRDFMNEEYTRQSLPSKKYRELLGSAVCVFNSNNSFIIENILREDSINYSWYNLIDKESGKLIEQIDNTIPKHLISK